MMLTQTLILANPHIWLKCVLYINRSWIHELSQPTNYITIFIWVRDLNIQYLFVLKLKCPGTYMAGPICPGPNRQDLIVLLCMTVTVVTVVAKFELRLKWDRSKLSDALDRLF